MNASTSHPQPRPRPMAIMAGGASAFSRAPSGPRPAAISENVAEFVAHYAAPRTERVGNAAFIRIDGAVMTEGGWLYEGIDCHTHEAVTKAVNDAAADPSVATIVLDFSCPGWSMEGSSGTIRAINDARASKNLLALVNDMAASGGAWMAVLCDRVVATPSSWFGSIGTVILAYDASKAFTDAGIVPVAVCDPPAKAEGFPGVAIGDATKAEWGRVVAQHSAAFFEAVASRRNISVEAVRGLNAAMLTAADAKSAGLVDEVMDAADFRARAAAMPPKQTNQPAPGSAGGSAPAASAARKEPIIMADENKNQQTETAAAPTVKATEAVTAPTVFSIAAATFAELSAAFPGDAAFIVRAQSENMTLTAAYAAWGQEQKARADKAEASLAAASKRPPSTEAVSATAGAVTASGEHAFIAKARAHAAAAKVDMGSAMAHVARTEPTVYASYREASSAEIALRTRARALEAASRLNA